MVPIQGWQQLPDPEVTVLHSPLLFQPFQHLYNQLPTLLCCVLEILKVASERDLKKPLKGRKHSVSGS